MCDKEELEINDTIQNIELVEIVDRLMLCYKNNIKPTNEELVKAYEAGINVKELERIMEIEKEGYEYEEY